MNARIVIGLAAAGLVGVAMNARGDEPANSTVNGTVNEGGATAAPASSSGGSSQSPLTVDGKPWKFMIAPYLWVPAQHGNVGIGNVNANVSMSVGDTWNALWDNFRFAGCIHVEAIKDKWSFFGDAMYMHLGNDVKDLPVEVNYKSGIFELGAGYAIHDGVLPGAASDSSVKVRLEPIAGTRIWLLDTEISTPIGSRSHNEVWIDGFAGIRGELAFNETFSLSGRIDVGTGMSELTWNALTMLNVNLSEHWALFAGWRWLSDDYSKGSGTGRFEYDMMFNGPFAGVKVTF